MKYVIEFGNRGGFHVENLIVPTRTAAEKLAASLVGVFVNDPHATGAIVHRWTLNKGETRATWQSRTHFVALSKLDGIPRGPASAALWRKPHADEQSDTDPHVLTYRA